MRPMCDNIVRSGFRAVAGLSAAALVAAMTAGSAPAPRVAAGPAMIRTAAVAGQVPPTDSQCEAMYQISNCAYFVPELARLG